MNKDSITNNQYIFIIISSMIALGILSMTSGLCKTAHQSAWISLFIGALYPFTIVFTASIIDNKTKHSSFWDINIKVYGKKLAYLFTLVFFLFYLLMFSSVVAGFTNVLKLTITRYLPPLFIIVSTILITVVISINGVYMVGRICEFYFYFALPIYLISAVFIIKGSLINIKPLISSFDEILRATPQSFYAFAGCEVCYLIISKISNKKNTMKLGIIAVICTTVIYVTAAFVTIYYLGWEITSKLEYPSLYLVETIYVPIISNFTALLLAMWSVLIFRNLITICYAVSYSLALLIKNKNYYKKSNLIFIPFALVLINLMIPQYNRKELLSAIFPYFIAFSLMWGIITAILVSIKFRGGNNEKL